MDLDQVNKMGGPEIQAKFGWTARVVLQRRELIQRIGVMIQPTLIKLSNIAKYITQQSNHARRNNDLHRHPPHTVKFNVWRDLYSVPDRSKMAKQIAKAAGIAGGIWNVKGNGLSMVGGYESCARDGGKWQMTDYSKMTKAALRAEISSMKAAPIFSTPNNRMKSVTGQLSEMRAELARRNKPKIPLAIRK